MWSYQKIHKTFGPHQNFLDIWSCPKRCEMGQICSWTYPVGNKLFAVGLRIIISALTDYLSASHLSFGISFLESLLAPNKTKNHSSFTSSCPVYWYCKLLQYGVLNQLNPGSDHCPKSSEGL